MNIFKSIGSSNSSKYVIKSENIFVYPCTWRNTARFDKNSVLNTEFNITKVGDAYLSESFIAHKNTSINDIFTCVIDGYRFDISFKEADSEDTALLQSFKYLWINEQPFDKSSAVLKQKSCVLSSVLSNKAAEAVGDLDNEDGFFYGLCFDKNENIESKNKLDFNAEEGIVVPKARWAAQAEKAEQADTATNAASATNAISANSANSLTSKNIGNTGIPVYFNNEGKPSACSSISLTADLAKKANDAVLAQTATKLSSVNIGSTSIPVYFNAEGKPAVCENVLADIATKAKTLINEDSSLINIGKANTPVYFNEGSPKVCSITTEINNNANRLISTDASGVFTFKNKDSAISIDSNKLIDELFYKKSTPLTQGEAYRCGWSGAGYITTDKKEIIFSVPLQKFTTFATAPTFFVPSNDQTRPLIYIRCRQNNRYLWGEPETLLESKENRVPGGLDSAGLQIEESSLRISLKKSSYWHFTEDTINNSAVGIEVIFYYFFTRWKQT